MSTILSDHLEIWGLEDEMVLFTDGSLGFGISLVPVDLSCQSDESIESYRSRIVQFLNGLPSSIDIQFLQTIEPTPEHRIDAHRNLMASEAGVMATSLTQSRIEHKKELNASGFLAAHELKCFIRRKGRSFISKRLKIFSKESLFPEIADRELEREIGSLRSMRDQIFQNLVSLGLSPSVISGSALLDLIYRQWNPSRPIDLSRLDTEDLRSSLLFTDVSLDNRGFSMGKYAYRVLSLKLLPEQTYPGMASCLRSLPFDSVLALSFHVPDQQKEIAHLQTQRRLTYSMVAGKRGVRDLESEAKFQDLETLLSDLVAQGEKVFHVSLQVILRSESPHDLEAQVAQTLQKFRELGGAEGMEEGLIAFDLFSSLAIPHAKSKDRIKRMKTSTLGDFLPLFGPWRGHENPSMLLRSRLGSLVNFDPFSETHSNYNQIVSGSSGSGKSFFTNLLLLQMLKENPMIFIVDIGGSYRKMCELLGGQYISLGVEGTCSINPFDLLAGETIPTPQKIKFLTSLVEVMTKEDHSTGIPRLERAELEEAIQRVYEKVPNPTLSDLRTLLLDHPEALIRRFGRILGSWSGNTPYGRFIDRPTSVKLSAPIISFDLKGMENYPDLQAVCLWIIMDLIWREVQGDRSRKKFLVFDECWKLLENESGAGFIAEVFRTFRKYYASAIAISQTLDDFAGSKVAGAMLANSSIRWCLSQKGSDPKRVQEILSLNDNERALIESLHQERGVYSEAFLIAQDQRSVVLVEPTPLEYWIATTDPRDISEIDRRQALDPSGDALGLVRKLADEYPRGIAAHRGGQ